MDVGGRRAAQLLQLVHRAPGISRAEAARELHLSSGAISDLVATAVAARLVSEGQPTPAGRGRPTRPLVAHPHGPLVLAAAITHEDWQVGAVELGGVTLRRWSGTHEGSDATGVLAALRSAGAQLDSQTGHRVQGWGVAAPGLVLGGRFLEAPQLGWHRVDLHQVRHTASAAVVVAGNDATLAAVGEARRGSATQAQAHLHLLLDAGIGGALTRGGTAELGAHGLAGEFGHMPFGDPARVCPCGAFGCWGEELGGGALARSLGLTEPTDPVAFARRVLVDAAAGQPAAVGAVRVLARVLGRGLGGLVNALDPDLVTLGGFGPALLDVAGDQLREAYHRGVVQRRQVVPPPVRAAGLGRDGSLIGAAEACWAKLLTTSFPAGAT